MNGAQNAWCTLVMLNDTYACGAAVVAQSLRNVHTKHLIYCMVSDGVSPQCREFLTTQFDRVIDVPLIKHKVAKMKSKKQNEIYGSWIHASFTKLNILNKELFPEIEKIILLDADMMFIENCDDLFDLNTPAMTFSSPWSHLYGNPRYGIFDHYGKISHGSEVPRKNILDGLDNAFVGLACMVLVTPGQFHWDVFNELLNKYYIYGNSQCVSGYDEQMFAEVFLKSGEPIYHIHQSYNWIIGKIKWLEPDEVAKTLQWYGPKPWSAEQINSSYADVISWWDIANSIIGQNPLHRKWFLVN